MSMHPQAIGPIPEETVRVARAAFPRGNPYLTLRDQLGTCTTIRTLRSSFPIAGALLKHPGS
jgi:transposase